MPGNKTKIKPCFFYDKNLNHFKVVSDKTRLIQIMLNLISNSVKFTRAGEISIGAELIKDSCKNTYYAQLYVKDTGIGLKQEDVNEIRKDENNIIKINIENDYNEMGTGLGLSIVKNLIAKLGHKLNVESVYGEGSEFNIIIENIEQKDSWSENSSNIGTIYQNNKFATIKSLIEIREHKLIDENEAELNIYHINKPSKV